MKIVSAAIIACAFALLPPLAPDAVCRRGAAEAAAKGGAPAIIYDAARLPAPVRQMRERILKAAKSGNIEALRPLFSFKGGTTRILPDGSKQDPIAYLKTISADGRGLEILANLAQILQSGAVTMKSGGQELYVWPYFAAIPPKTLSDSKLVEAYQIMSVDDFDTIKEIGHYIYFRAGIAPDGSWRFFLTGDSPPAQDDAPQAQADKADENSGAAPRGRADALPLPDDSGDLPEE